MKNAIRTFAVAVCVAGTLFTGCMSRSDTTDRVQGAMQENTSNVAEAQQARNSAMADSVQQFKRDSEAVIRTYEKRIAEFKAKIKTEGHENKAVYERKLAALEQKYGDLKTQLREYSAEGKGEWTSFRNEFSRDMDDLGKSISNFFTSDK